LTICHQLHNDLPPVNDIFRLDDCTTGRAVDAILENVAVEELAKGNASSMRENLNEQGERGRTSSSVEEGLSVPPAFRKSIQSSAVGRSLEFIFNENRRNKRVRLSESGLKASSDDKSGITPTAISKHMIAKEKISALLENFPVAVSGAW